MLDRKKLSKAMRVKRVKVKSKRIGPYSKRRIASGSGPETSGSSAAHSASTVAIALAVRNGLRYGRTRMFGMSRSRVVTAA